MKTLHTKLEQLFELGELTQQRDDLAFLSVGSKQLRPIISHLRDSEGFTHLVLLTAVDWLEEGLFQLTYLLSNRKKRQDIGLRVMLNRDNASMVTIHDLWPTAATYQRELKEMFGIDFPDSPNVNDEFILEGWRDIPPYRRDFDTLKYSDENYNIRDGRETKDPAQYMKEQLYPSSDNNQKQGKES